MNDIQTPGCVILLMDELAAHAEPPPPPRTARTRATDMPAVLAGAGKS